MAEKKKKGPANPERAFGLSVGAVLLLIAAFLWWRGYGVAVQVVGGIGAVLLVLGYLRPSLLKYPSAAWWAFALMLGHINARIILTLIFVLVLTPIGLLWRLIGRDPLARRRRNWPGWSPYPPRYRDTDHYTRMY
ncbi:MAG: SxtJ family membrane protein [Vicinamibacterales bacterium]|nr:SxtJ family membrane protein [Vicinamibacterales bacterium]